MVDFDIPVIKDSWRTDKFFLYIILPSKIFMVVFYDNMYIKINGNKFHFMSDFNLFYTYTLWLIRANGLILFYLRRNKL